MLAVGDPSPAIRDVADRVIGLMAGEYKAHLPLLPGAVDAVRTLAARWPAAVASSATRRAVSGVRDAGLRTTVFPAARAGAIRYAGKMVVKGTAVAAAATASGGEAAVDKVQSAVQATSNAGSSVKHVLAHASQVTTDGAKDGGAAVYYGAKRTPYEVAHGAKSLWRAVW